MVKCPARPTNAKGLVLFDLTTQRWIGLAKIIAGFPCWSKDEQHVYFLGPGDEPSVVRVRIHDRKVERVADLKDFRQNMLLGDLAGSGPRGFPARAPRHGDAGSLRHRLESAVIHTRRSGPRFRDLLGRMNLPP